MKINQLKINAYGKIKEKEINLENNINIIYGENEAGKSTILNFMINSFYGISKNKNGKNISDFDKYTPWIGEEFSGKLEYELENQEKFEIFRDFKKKNPKIFNSEMEDISKQFNIDKNKGNEFFYEQTKVDEALFLSTVLIRQQEVKLEKQDQNILIQKVANLVGTGEDNVSYKRAKDRLNRRLLEEIGTERTREKPINVVVKEIEKLEQEREEVEKSVDIKCKIEEKKNSLAKELEQLEIESEKLKEEKLKQENEKMENEKNNLEINYKNNLKNENSEKIKKIEDKIEEIKLKNKTLLEKNKEINSNKNKINKKILIIFLGIIIINIFQFIFIQNKYFNYIFLLTVPMVIIYSLFFKKIKNNNEKMNYENLEKINTEIKQLNFEMDLLRKNNKKLEEEINIKKIEKNNKNNLEKINLEIQTIENEINRKKFELHSLQLDYKNIEPRLEKLSNIEENLVNHKEQMVSLKKLEKSMKLALEILDTSYDKMKNTVTPKFTDKLSETIGTITEGKYRRVRLNDETGLIVELESGNYIPADRLSIGTIDQLYLSLRLAMVEELSEEKMPIIFDEAFAYYDKKRLKNILEYMAKRFKTHQIIIFTCTNREEQILKELNLEFNVIHL